MVKVKEESVPNICELLSDQGYVDLFVSENLTLKLKGDPERSKEMRELSVHSEAFLPRYRARQGTAPGMG